VRLAGLLLACALLAACGAKSPADGQIASFDADDYSGRWVVINYWATWCKPCIEEIPELNAFDAAHPQVAVLGVNYDQAGGEELAAQARKLGIAFPLLVTDPSGQLGQPRPEVLPTTLVLDPQGKLAATLTGPQTAETLKAATAQP